MQEDVPLHAMVMHEEPFGPIAPCLPVDSMDEAWPSTIAWVQAMPHRFVTGHKALAHDACNYFILQSPLGRLTVYPIMKA